MPLNSCPVWMKSSVLLQQSTRRRTAWCEDRDSAPANGFCGETCDYQLHWLTMRRSIGLEPNRWRITPSLASISRRSCGQQLEQPSARRPTPALCAGPNFGMHDQVEGRSRPAPTCSIGTAAPRRKVREASPASLVKKGPKPSGSIIMALSWPSAPSTCHAPMTRNFIVGKWLDRQRA